MLDKIKISKELTEFNLEDVTKYIDYCHKLQTETKDGSLKNPYAKNIQDETFVKYFKQVAKDGLMLDGIHITIQKTGITYDYVAYKNKMYLVYPESTVDVQLVYKDDDFNVEKQSGTIRYIHKINNPFIQTEADIIGGYCVIKNKRGEFFTPLSKAEIDKHRKVAKTDFIWKQWFKEMALKTIIKKACKTHFADVYQNIEEIDNENYNLDNSTEIELEIKQTIENIEDVETLNSYYMANKDIVKDKKAFIKALAMRKKELTDGNNQ